MVGVLAGLVSLLARAGESAAPRLDRVLMAYDSVIRGALQSCSAEAVVIRVGGEDTRLEPATIKNVVMNGTVSCEWRGRLRSAPPIAVRGERGPGAAGLSPDASVETAARGRWYGGETLAADGSAIWLAIIAGAVANSNGLGSPGGSGRSDPRRLDARARTADHRSEIDDVDRAVDLAEERSGLRARWLWRGAGRALLITDKAGTRLHRQIRLRGRNEVRENRSPGTAILRSSCR